jgi:hypothetical protein
VAYPQLLEEDQSPGFKKKSPSNFQTIAGDLNPSSTLRCIDKAGGDHVLSKGWAWRLDVSSDGHESDTT